ncbi:hypothetical protein KGO5_04235 [Sinorhizobium sp. KGO-5]|uniref:hypothetical protein n=1 Tax=Sinorhizobium sp. KGO-5 TaxID=1470810 RepID=UPI0029491023|nr:hypothetical protein KGO5_04235 [Sinorhizobium sp. KGO-5]
MTGLVDMTKEFFDSIPEEGACLVALTNDMAKWLKFRLPQWRGDDLANRCRIVGINRMSSVNKLIGEQRRVMLHPLFVSRARASVLAEAERVAAGCNAMRP